MSTNDFIQLLQQLSVGDNNLRKAAEDTYDKICSNNANQLPNMLLEVLSNKTIDYSTQKLSSILLRRYFTQQSKSSEVLSADSMRLFRSNLLNVLENETDIYLKARVCDIVGLLCDEDIDEAQWPELLPYTYRCLQVLLFFF